MFKCIININNFSQKIFHSNNVIDENDFFQKHLTGNTSIEPYLIESYNAKSNYFYLVHSIIIIQSKFRQILSIRKYNKLKNKSLTLNVQSREKNQNTENEIKAENICQNSTISSTQF